MEKDKPDGKRLDMNGMIERKKEEPIRPHIPEMVENSRMQILHLETKI